MTCQFIHPSVWPSLMLMQDWVGRHIDISALWKQFLENSEADPRSTYAQEMYFIRGHSARATSYSSPESTHISRTILVLCQAVSRAPGLRNSTSHSRLRRFVVAVVLEITYGCKITSDDDQFVKNAEAFDKIVAQVGAPGLVLLDFFPICETYSLLQVKLPLTFVQQ